MRSSRVTPALLAALAAATTVACSSAGATRGGDVPEAVAITARDTALARIARQYRVSAIADRRFTHAEYWSAIAPALASPALRTTPVGASIQGRALQAITFGDGPTTVLLWSQMHGDESTASMALADIFAWLAADGDDARRSRLARELTVVFLPMLNPDGAEQFERENAVGIDINRDARRLSSPEARALKALRDSIAPAFGFNLHDQSARIRVGRTGAQAAISLLAPAFDAERSYNPVRSRARLVAATIVEALRPPLEGRVAKYDDTFNPRAFGDLIQQWGTSTVLIESGAIAGDPEKQQLRAHNVVAILAALDAIATGGYRDADPDAYESLPFNAGGAYDVLLMGGSVVLPGQPPTRADVAINYDDPVAKTGGTVREVGDLEGAVALDTVDMTGRELHPATGVLTNGALLIGARAEFNEK